MWQSLLSILAGILQLLSGWQRDTREEKIRQEGKNEEKLDNINQLEREKNISKDIINGLNDSDRQRLRDKYKDGGD